MGFPHRAASSRLLPTPRAIHAGASSTGTFWQALNARLLKTILDISQLSERQLHNTSGHEESRPENPACPLALHVCPLPHSAYPAAFLPLICACSLHPAEETGLGPKQSHHLALGFGQVKPPQILILSGNLHKSQERV